MIPILEFTPKSWGEELWEKAERAINVFYYLNGNENIKCWKDNTSIFPEAFIGCENKNFHLIEYGYADDEASIEKYLKNYIDDPNNEYFIEIGLMSLDYDKFYKNGYYINENGEDTGSDYWGFYSEDHLKGKRQYENCWVTFSIYEIKNNNDEQ